jgi:hypothetical protein
MVCQFQNGMVSPPATSDAGVHATGDTKSEHFQPAGVRKLSAKQFSRNKMNKNHFPSKSMDQRVQCSFDSNYTNTCIFSLSQFEELCGPSLVSRCTVPKNLDFEL